ncbi:hypothetical protein GPECTOR_21g724 [Gonium pectorale]|uniref:Origin recognition complex subunit 5 C-terminal domain-containing protein n=1 Tax=Gonium pectorale TaxID=33097 RepID=A0A150GI43_GONPE|nr:hypothetical protein GPECTOR_21g724 [Gonium pectorale]|eukprot:KXZ49498.1 hypothetical protein GPECTOR_21g724 [Gonium pectorale]
MGHCLETWGRRFAYLPLPQEYKLRQMFNALLSQLWVHAGVKRKREGGFGATAGADSWNEFAEAIADVCPPSAQHVSVLALDNMEWGAHRNLLPQLLAAIRWRRASVVVIAITSTAPQDLRFGSGLGLPLPMMRSLHFPAYDREQLCAALAADPPSACGNAAAAAPSCGLRSPRGASSSGSPRPSPDLYAAFVSAYVVTPFSPLSRSAADLAAVAGWLWPLYSRPLEAGQVRADAPVESLFRQLDGPMKRSDVVRRLLEAFRPGMRSPPPGLLQAAATAMAAAGAAGGAGRGGSAANGAEHGGGSGGAGGDADGGGALVLNLGKAAKLLLLAAFVASRNKPTLDKELFEFRKRAGTGRRRGGAGAGRAGEQQQEADRQAEAAKEARLKGPHAFPLTRLTSIFHRLWAAAPSLEHELYGNLYGKGPSAADGDVVDIDLATGFAGGRTGIEAVWSQSTAVLSTVTGLQGMGLLAKHGAADDPLEQPRFTCGLGEDLALKLAADVGLNLQNYLMYDK